MSETNAEWIRRVRAMIDRKQETDYRYDLVMKAADELASRLRLMEGLPVYTPAGHGEIAVEVQHNKRNGTMTVNLVGTPGQDGKGIASYRVRIDGCSCVYDACRENRYAMSMQQATEHAVGVIEKMFHLPQA